MAETLYQKKIREILEGSKEVKELAKIIYSDKLNRYSFEFKEKKITGEPLTPKFYRWMKQDIKFHCKRYHYMDAFEKIDPNIWFLIKKFEYTYGTDKARNLKLEYLTSMSEVSNYKNIPFRVLYNMEDKKRNIFDRKRSNIYKNIELQTRIQSFCNFNIIKVEKNNCEKNIKIRNNKFKNNKSIFKRITAIAFATLAGISFGSGEDSGHSEQNNERYSSIGKLNINDELGNYENNYLSTEPSITDQSIVTNIVTEKFDIDSMTTQDGQIDKLKNNDKSEDSNEEKNLIKEESKKEPIKVGDKIEIVSNDAQYYIDSYGSGIGYSYEELKEKYQIKEVYAEYVTETGVVHGIGITKNNEKIHFGWLGKDVEIEKVIDDDELER